MPGFPHSFRNPSREFPEFADWCRVWGQGFGVKGLGLRVWGLGLRYEGHPPLAIYEGLGFSFKMYSLIPFVLRFPYSSRNPNDLVIKAQHPKSSMNTEGAP